MCGRCGGGHRGLTLSGTVPCSYPLLRAGHLCGRCGRGWRGLTLSGTVPCSHPVVCLSYVRARWGGGGGDDSPCQVLYLAPTFCYVVVTCGDAVKGGPARTHPFRYCTLHPPSAMCWSHVKALWRGTGRTNPVRYCASLPPSALLFWRVHERKGRKTDRGSLEVGGGEGRGWMTRLGSWVGTVITGS